MIDRNQIIIAKLKRKISVLRLWFIERAKIRPHFDFQFYLERNADIRQRRIDPILHYCIHGWREGRDPHPSFSTLTYLSLNPDVKAAGVNPYYHYLTEGRASGRPVLRPDDDPVVHPGGYKAIVLERLGPATELLEDQPVGVERRADNVRATLLDRLREFGRPGARRLALSFSHSNYVNSTGGTEICIRREQRGFASRQIDYLHVSPIEPVQRLARRAPSEDLPVLLILNGEPLPACGMSDLEWLLDACRSHYEATTSIVHHLMGHDPQRVGKIIKTFGAGEAFVWVHDYFMLCPSWILQRNMVLYCGAPPIESNACQLCYYGLERRAHLDRMTAFFDSIDAHCIAPSAFSANLFRTRSSYRYRALSVVPHVRLVASGKADHVASGGKTRLRIGFVGRVDSTRGHKGWPAFERLFTRHRDGDRFDFVHVGETPAGLAGLSFARARVTVEDPDAMLRTLRENDVDAVLCWRDSRETFSISTHEAIAAGCFIITNEASGNIAAVVRSEGAGVVLRDEEHLLEYVENGTFSKDYHAWRQRRQPVSMQWSDMTLELLSEVLGQ